MVKKGILIALAIFLVTGLNSLWSEDDKESRKACCIAGEYKGFHKDIPSQTCMEPGSDEFDMYIYQDKDCTSDIWGKIVGSDGEPMEFKGTVTPTRGGCCKIHGIAKKPGEQVEFKAILCLSRIGKWYSKHGKYEHSNGCTGEFSIKQK